MRALFSFRWEDPRTGRERPLKLKIMIYMTPETLKTTRFHVFLFLRLDAPRLRFLLPVARQTEASERDEPKPSRSPRSEPGGPEHVLVQEEGAVSSPS